MAKSYHSCNQKQYIEKGQTMQWLKVTNGVIRNSKSKRDRQCNGQGLSKGY